MASASLADVAQVTVRRLTEQEQQMLAFERGWWRSRGAKEAAARDQFGFSATRYAQQLNLVLDNPAALAADPATVRRLTALRSRGRVRGADLSDCGLTR